jgi:hypothetical protein
MPPDTAIVIPEGFAARPITTIRRGRDVNRFGLDINRRRRALSQCAAQKQSAKKPAGDASGYLTIICASSIRNCG